MDDLIDLDGMLPREFKEAPTRKDDDIEYIEVIGEADGTVTPEDVDSCHSCNRTSHEVILMFVFYKGEERLICPKCLMGAMGTAVSEIPQIEESQIEQLGVREVPRTRLDGSDDTEQIILG